MFICREITCVQQTENKKIQWLLTAILMKGIVFCDNKCLYVEKITYSK